MFVTSEIARDTLPRLRLLVRKSMRICPEERILTCSNCLLVGSHTLRADSLDSLDRECVARNDTDSRHSGLSWPKRIGNGQLES